MFNYNNIGKEYIKDACLQVEKISVIAQNGSSIDKDKNMKLDDKQLISVYNGWAKEQKTYYRKADVVCPYFPIDLNTVKKIKSEYTSKKILSDLKEDGSDFNPCHLWEKILKLKIQKYTPDKKDKYILKIKRVIKFKPRKILDRNKPPISTKLYSSEDICSIIKNKGLYLIPHHFRWYEENEIIDPIFRQGDKKYYSVFQIYTLDYLEMWKEDSLHYPDPFYHPIIGWTRKGSMIWQEHLLLNNETLKTRGKSWNELVEILLDIKDLYDMLQNVAYLEVQKIKDKRREFIFRDTFNTLIVNVGDIYAKKISRVHTKMSEAIIKYWVGVCAIQVRRLNPLYSRIYEYEPLLKLFADAEKIEPFPSFAISRNNIKLANFYFQIMKYLDFYLECLTKEKYLPTSGILSDDMNKIESGSRTCKICGKPFIPNLKKSGGRKQITCGSENCKKEQENRHAKEVRKIKKLNK